MKYDEWQQNAVNEEKVETLEQVLQIDTALCQLLVQKGICSFDQAKDFFRPTWDKLHDPFLMMDMEKAVERLDLALRENETILVFGDYDVDGTMSVSLLVQFLLDIGHQKVLYYMPDRYNEGYGLSEKGIDYAVDNGGTLLITVDCGIRANKQVDYARRHGIDVMICDHHIPADSWPMATAVLDPKRPDCSYPFKELCGCGVVFKLLQGFLHYRNIKDDFLQDYTDFVVIGTACDIVSMSGENRIIAHFGLKKLQNTKRFGLRSLIKASQRKKPINTNDLVFGLGPIINASGRMADAQAVVQLMLTKEKEAAMAQTEVLKKRNLLRKEFDMRTMEEALDEIEKSENVEEQSCLVLFQPHWHKGVIGIIAARIATEFHRPCIIVTTDNNKLVASGRSTNGIDIYEAVAECSDHLLSFGGHPFAVGLTMKPESRLSFIAQFREAVDRQMSDTHKAKVLDISAGLALSAITPKFYRILRQYAPFGPDNMNPVFMTKGVLLEGSVELLQENHIRFMVTDNEGAIFPAIAFGLGAQKEILDANSNIDICYTIQENHWMGKPSIQLVVKDFCAAG